MKDVYVYNSYLCTYVILNIYVFIYLFIYVFKYLSISNEIFTYKSINKNK